MFLDPADPVLRSSRPDDKMRPSPSSMRPERFAALTAETDSLFLPKIPTDGATLAIVSVGMPVDLWRREALKTLFISKC